MQTVPHFLVFTIALTCSCAGPDRSRASAALPSVGTVGRAAFEHNLTLMEVSRWSRVLAPLAGRVKADSTYHLRLGFPVDSSIESQITRVAQSDIAEHLASVGMSPGEFVIITAAYSAAVMGKTIRDTSERHELPMNVNPRNVQFIEQNRSAIHSIFADTMRVSARPNEELQLAARFVKEAIAVERPSVHANFGYNAPQAERRS